MPQTLPRLQTSLQRYTLRQRMLLLFAALAGAALLALVLGLYLGHVKHGSPWALDALVVGGVLAGCAILALIAGMWWLFDEHVAKPLERLAGELRARSQSHIVSELEDMEAHHLGDLAPAATALLRHLNEARNELAEIVARETTRQVTEKEGLRALLSDLPMGVLVCTADHHLVLYNGPAQALLGSQGCNLDGVSTPSLAAAGSGPLCLGRPVSDYLEEDALLRAHQFLQEHGDSDIDFPFSCVVRSNGRQLQARMRLLGERLSGPGRPTGGYLLTLNPAPQPQPQRQTTPRTAAVSRCVAYDFELLQRGLHTDMANTPLDALTYVVFDTETTGLLPGRGDQIVQLAAVRIVNGRRVETEVLDTLVNPGRPIPLSSTRIHGISDAMVSDAPTIEQAGRQLHSFARGAVLVAHNAGFDMAFLHRDEDRIGLRFDNPVLDTVRLSALVFGDAENHSLDVLAARLGVELSAAARHTALGDATATAEVLLKLLPALQARGLQTFGALEAECRRRGRLSV